MERNAALWCDIHITAQQQEHHWYRAVALAEAGAC